MADKIVVYWRDIPAQVIVKQGRKSAKRELSLRFTEAIDMCAMRTGAASILDWARMARLKQAKAGNILSLVMRPRGGQDAVQAFPQERKP